MSGKSRRKPVRLAVASSSLTELKQEVEDTAGHVTFLLTLNIPYKEARQMDALVEYLCERNNEAGKLLARLDPAAVMNRNTPVPPPSQTEADMGSDQNQDSPPHRDEEGWTPTVVQDALEVHP